MAYQIFSTMKMSRRNVEDLATEPALIAEFERFHDMLWSLNDLRSNDTNYDYYYNQVGEKHPDDITYAIAYLTMDAEDNVTYVNVDAFKTLGEAGRAIGKVQQDNKFIINLAFGESLFFHEDLWKLNDRGHIKPAYYNSGQQRIDFRFKKNLAIRVGDLVEAGGSMFNDRPLMRVTKIEIRRDWDFSGARTGDLLYYELPDGTVPDFHMLDASHITRIVERAPLEGRSKTHRNEYAEMTEASWYKVSRKEYKTNDWGSPDWLVQRIIGRRPHLNVPFSINPNKFFRLWRRAGFPGAKGMIKNQDTEIRLAIYPFTVNFKAFEKWVLRNYHRFMSSNKELRPASMANSKREYDEYTKDLDFASDYNSESDRVKFVEADDAADLGLYGSYDDMY